MNKVFGIGCPRTGTTTLGSCLKVLGYRNRTWDPDAFRSAIVEGSIEPVIQAAAGFDSFDDLPWCALYRELDVAYPGSKFILTVRRDSTSWLASRVAHAKRHGIDLDPTDGHESPASQQRRNSVRWPKDLAHYESHNSEVRSYFADRPGDFLELCWEKGDDWTQLCEFLDVEIPFEPMPHRNRNTRRSQFTAWLRRWYRRS